MPWAGPGWDSGPESQGQVVMVHKFDIGFVEKFVNRFVSER